MTSFTDRVDALKGLKALGALTDDELQKETAAILAEMRGGAPSQLPDHEDLVDLRSTCESHGGERSLPGSQSPGHGSPGSLASSQDASPAKKKRVRPDEHFTGEVASWLSEQLSNVLAQHKDHTGHGACHYSYEPKAMWEDVDLNARFTSLIAKASTKHPNVGLSWRKLINKRLETRANKPIQKAMAAGKIPKPSDGKKRALNNKSNRVLAAEWEEQIAAKERQASAEKRRRLLEADAPLPTVKANVAAGSTSGSVQQEEAAVPTTEGKSLVAGTQISHAWNGKGYFPEDEDVPGVLTGSPQLVYNAMIVQKDNNTDRYRIIFNSCETVYVASLRKEDEGIWWWFGHQASDGKMTASKLNKASKK